MTSVQPPTAAYMQLDPLFVQLWHWIHSMSSLLFSCQKNKNEDFFHLLVAICEDIFLFYTKYQEIMIESKQTGHVDSD
jgi:hypothetical protein